VEDTGEGVVARRAATSLPARAVIAVLQRVFAEHGAPEFIRSDNGPEFIAKIVKRWLATAGTQTMYIDPGSPWQNPYVESFHGRLRDECLNMETFANLAEAKVINEAWRREYNTERPHSSLGYLTPLEFKAQWQRTQMATADGQKRPSLSLLGPTDGLDQLPPQTTMGRAPELGPPSVRPPATALGSHSCGALPSERANRNVA
jgi:putative transposase